MHGKTDLGRDALSRHIPTVSVSLLRAAPWCRSLRIRGCLVGAPWSISPAHIFPENLSILVNGCNPTRDPMSRIIGANYRDFGCSVKQLP